MMSNSLHWKKLVPLLLGPGVLVAADLDGVLCGSAETLSYVDDFYLIPKMKDPQHLLASLHRFREDYPDPSCAAS